MGRESTIQVMWSDGRNDGNGRRGKMQYQQCLVVHASTAMVPEWVARCAYLIASSNSPAASDAFAVELHRQRPGRTHFLPVREDVLHLVFTTSANDDDNVLLTVARRSQ